MVIFLNGLTTSLLSDVVALILLCFWHVSFIPIDITFWKKKREMNGWKLSVIELMWLNVLNFCSMENIFKNLNFNLEWNKQFLIFNLKSNQMKVIFFFFEPNLQIQFTKHLNLVQQQVCI